MKKISFHKYQGTGNDFVMIDNRSGKIKLTTEEIKAICDRRFGVGADGIILLDTHDSYDFSMNYYNADGTQSFCGNGSRCVVRFAETLGLVKEQARYLAIDGEHTSSINHDEIATLMQPVSEVQTIGKDYFVHTGSPHYIIFTEDIHAIDLLKEAHRIRYNDAYRKEGTNVNFVEISEREILVRTYERGVENETLSCGTGVTAVAIAYCHRQGLKGHQEIGITTLGGPLRISLDENNGKFTDIRLIGPATKVFEGVFEI